MVPCRARPTDIVRKTQCTHSIYKRTHDDDPLVDRAAKDGAHFVFVQFNAWLYQCYDDARAALMEVIASALEEEAEKRKTGVDKVKDLLWRVRWLHVAKVAGASSPTDRRPCKSLEARS